MNLKVRVTPKSSKNHVEWVSDGEIKAWLTAPPVDGEANAALIALLAKVFGVSKSKVLLVKGSTSRHKEVQIEGLTKEDILARLPQPPLLND